MDRLSNDELSRRFELLQRELYELRRQLAGLDQTTEASLPEALLVVSVDGERVGLPLSAVQEVVPVPELNGLPEAPPWVPGLLSLRGETLPVLDIAARVRRCRRALELSDLIVVCEQRGQRIGLVVQEVFDVMLTTDASLESAGNLPHAPYLAGLLRSNGSPVLLFDLTRLLALSDLPEELPA